jgi:iron(III) transport system substrate-binding protein
MEGHSMQARIFRRGARAFLLLAVGAVALVAAAVGYSATAKAPPPVPAKLKADIAAVAGLGATARDAKLAQMAEAEGGQLNVYTSLSSLVVKSVQSQWAHDYPNIKLNLFRGSSEDVTARVLAERKAHPTDGADSVETNGTNMLFFQHFKDVLVPYTKSAYRTQIPKEFRFDTWTADRIEKFVVAWNTNLVQGADVPKTWADLANPKWAGKITLEPTDVDWFAALYTYLQQHGGKNGKAMTTKQLDALFSGIAKNAQLISGHTNEATALAAGQVAIVVSGHAQSVEQLQAKKAPIAFAPFVKPVIQRPQGVGITYWAPHPAAALLWYDWLLSSTAQNIMTANGVEPANSTVPGDSAFQSNPFTISLDLRPIVSNYAKWQKKFDSFTRLGKGG